MNGTQLGTRIVHLFYSVVTYDNDDDDGDDDGNHDEDDDDDDIFPSFFPPLPFCLLLLLSRKCSDGETFCSKEPTTIRRLNVPFSSGIRVLLCYY